MNVSVQQKINRMYILEVIDSHHLLPLVDLMLRECERLGTDKNPYHNSEHMLNVARRAMMLCEMEGGYTRKPELLIAALCHDVGHSGGTTDDHTNIEVAVRFFNTKVVPWLIVQNMERSIQFSDIEEAIRDTEYPFIRTPDTTISTYLRDADALESYDIDGPKRILTDLRAELINSGKPMTMAAMLDAQRPFVESIVYFTRAARQIAEECQDAMFQNFDAYAAAEYHRMPNDD